jgi:hypothetical protein
VSRLLKHWALGVAVSGLLIHTSVIAAQEPGAAPGESYVSIAWLPDWSGAWVRPFSDFEAELIRARDPQYANRPRLRPEYEKQRAPAERRMDTGVSANGAAATGPACLPGRIPYVMWFSFAIEFLPSPGRVTMLLEQGSVIRRIYTDGRAHAADAEPTWAGDSIGQWEGDTLVVRTTHFKSRPERGLLMTSDKAIVTERIRLRDKDHLQIDTVVEDPVALLEPWRTSRTYARSNAGFFDRVCDNNRDGNDEEPNLTPPGAPR